MLTSREIARMAGVSQATVSRVLQGSPLVAETTRDRVLAVVAGTGYQPNRAARAMRTRRTETIGIVLANLTNPFYPEVLRELGSALAVRGLQMIVWDSEGPNAEGAVSAIGQQLVDGLIFTTALPGSTTLHETIALRAPVVLVNRTVEGLACDQVDSDNRVAAAEIARYFAENGHRRAGLITSTQAASTARDRTAGFLEGCKRYDIAVTKKHIVDGGFTHVGGAAGLRRLMSSSNPPSAVFCVNDVSALGALDAAASLKIAVPDDLWVVGYDDIDMASWESYGLTTARQPLADMADAAVELLTARIASPERPASSVRLKSELIIRRTTNFVPFSTEPAVFTPSTTSTG